MRLLRSSSVYFLGFINCLTLFAVISCSSETPTEITPKKNPSSIIGGQTAVAGDAVTRSTVALVTAKNDILKEQCTGTLVSRNLILTAAHCLEGLRPTNVWIHFGEVLPRPFYLNQLTQVKDFIVHPKFGPHDYPDFPETEINDIALVVLKNEAPPSFTPVQILSGTSPAVGEQLLLAGYGHISDVNTVRAKSLNFARVLVSRLWKSLIVVDQTNKSGACKGDSGGPAYLETANGLIVVGITRGAHNKSPHCHGFVEYTNATAYKSFILETAQVLEAELPQFTE